MAGRRFAATKLDDSGFVAAGGVIRVDDDPLRVVPNDRGERPVDVFGVAYFDGLKCQPDGRRQRLHHFPRRRAGVVRRVPEIGDP
jgi:hypothetical protein